MRMILSPLVVVMAASAMNAEPQGTPVDTVTYPASWTQSWEGQVADANLAAGGSCAAVALKGAVVVIGATGKELWRWQFSNVNRFVAAQHVAVAPSCQFVAFVGDTSYRYAWIVHRNGTRVPISMRSTPLGVAISHAGDLVAIGTSANDVWLFDANGTLRWRTHLDKGCCVRELSFADDDCSVFVTSWGAGVVSVTGTLKWAASLGGMWAAQDGRIFVGHWEPPHGPGISSLSVLDEAGKLLWGRFGSSGVASLSGDVIAALVNDNQKPTDEDAYREQATTLTLMSRRGEIIATLPGGGTPLAFSGDGRHLLVRRSDRLDALDRNGASVWSIPLQGYPDVQVLPSLKSILVWTADDVRWFSPP